MSYNNVHANPSVTDNAESAAANKTGLLSPVLRPLGGAAPVDCSAAGAVLLAAPPDVEAPDVERPEVEPPEVDGAGVGLPVSPPGMLMSPEDSAGRLMDALGFVRMDGARVGKPTVVSVRVLV